MSFSENLQFYRKRKNMTQEALAEKLEVSRQTVSKWESGAAMPETEKIMRLCDLLGCDMDTLMRGDAKSAAEGDLESYDRHQNRFTAAVCTGVALVISAVAILLALNGIGITETISVMIFLALISVSVVIFIFSGMSHSDFVRKNPVAPAAYPTEVTERFERRFRFLIALPIAAILLGVIWIIGSNELATPENLTKESWEYFSTAIFMAIIAASSTLLVYAGMQQAKYNTAAYNSENNPDPEAKAAREKTDRYSGAIMLTATAIFLALGFIWNLWKISWVVFPIGGIICGIVSSLTKK